MNGKALTPAMASTKKIGSAVVLATLTLGILVAVGELILRCAAPIHAAAPMVSPEMAYDSVLGWKGDPGFDAPVGAEHVRVAINSHGFRDDDWTEKLERAKRRLNG